MTVLDWFQEEGSHIKNDMTTNSTLKKWHADLDRWFTHATQELLHFHLTGERSKIDFHPRVDISKAKQQYEVTVELPGVHPQELQLESEHHKITVSGEKRSSHESKENNFYKAECAYGHFERTFSLPEDADMGTIQAEFSHGALHVTVNRLQLPSNKKKIEIKTL